MSTSIVSLDTTQYVRVNAGYLSMILQAHNDSVRIALSTLQPARNNTAFHTLGGADAPLNLGIVDVNVWALAMSDTSSLIVTEASIPASVRLLDRANRIMSDAVPSLPVTTVDHFMIHYGTSFVHSEIYTLDAGLTKEFIIVNTTAKPVHLRDLRITSSLGNMQIDLHHGVTTDTDGTAVVIHDKNLNTNNTATAVMTQDPTVVVAPAATHMYALLLVGGKASGGVMSTEDDEIVLKQNEKVLLRIVNNAAQADSFSVNVDFLDVGSLLAILDAL